MATPLSSVTVFVSSNSVQHIKANRDYYDYTALFDGTSGVGNGTYAEMTAITTCTQGVGFWVTDRGNWNTLGEDGQLYQCDSSNNWVLYYEPLTYPHPLTLLGTSTCSQADANTDDVVDITELMNYIADWKNGIVTIVELMTSIGEWKNGC